MMIPTEARNEVRGKMVIARTGVDDFQRRMVTTGPVSRRIDDGKTAGRPRTITRRRPSTSPAVGGLRTALRHRRRRSLQARLLLLGLNVKQLHISPQAVHLVPWHPRKSLPVFGHASVKQRLCLMRRLTRIVPIPRVKKKGTTAERELSQVHTFDSLVSIYFMCSSMSTDREKDVADAPSPNPGADSTQPPKRPRLNRNRYNGGAGPGQGHGSAAFAKKALPLNVDSQAADKSRSARKDERSEGRI